APMQLMRDVSQLTPDAWGYPGGVTFAANLLSVWMVDGGSGAVTSPNPADGGVPLSPWWLYEAGQVFALRGLLRGAYYPLTLLNSGAFVNNVAMLDDVVIGGQTRRVAMVRYGTSNVLQMAFDLTGTWG
nr:hypothetical protein [Burkholderiaceae bacterium]